MLIIIDRTNDSVLYIWAGKNCIKNRIIIVISDEYSSMNDMFDDNAYESAKYFDEINYDKAVNYTYNVIKKQFPKSFKEEYNTKFKMHKCLADLQEVALNPKNFVYEDYYDLATFEDVEQLYFCDLIITDGRLGLNYSKYSDSYCNECDSLYFEKWEPNLSSEVTLMLGMQERLKKYIQKRIDYDIKSRIGI